MSKYIDAEKLIAEIKRLDKKNKELLKSGGSIGREFLFGIGAGYADIIKIIDSLQQEQPEVDLDKEIEDWCDKNITGVRPIYTADSLIYSLLPKTARHFYELGLNSKKEK